MRTWFGVRVRNSSTFAESVLYKFSAIVGITIVNRILNSRGAEEKRSNVVGRRRSPVIRMQPLSDQQDIVKSGQNRKGESGAQKTEARNRYPSSWTQFHQQHKKDSGHLRERVRLAKNARAKIAQPGDSIENCAGTEDRDVAAEDDHGELPGDLMQDCQHQEHSAEQQLVSDGIEVLSQDGLLLQQA